MFEKRFLIIDGNAIIHRVFHAIPLSLTTKKGEPVNAIYGFATFLLKALRELKPDYLVCTFDLGAPTFRHEEFKEYKAQRPKMRQELVSQLDRIKQMVRAFDIPIYEKEGFEADDLIGTIAKKENNLETIIMTGDLDTLQLVDEKIKIYTLKKGISQTIIYDSEKVKERYDLEPKQLIDFKALRGDPSDNFSGVKGIGEKTAIKLIKEFGSIENLYKNLEEDIDLELQKLSLKVKQTLFEHKEEAFLSKKLATIFLDAPIDFNLEECQRKELDKEKIINLFKELEFYSLINRLEGL